MENSPGGPLKSHNLTLTNFICKLCIAFWRLSRAKIGKGSLRESQKIFFFFLTLYLPMIFQRPPPQRMAPQQIVSNYLTPAPTLNIQNALLNMQMGKHGLNLPETFAFPFQKWLPRLSLLSTKSTKHSLA